MTTLHCAKGLLVRYWESHLGPGFCKMQPGAGGIFLLIPKHFTASSCNGRQHPQLWGSSASVGPKSTYSLKKIYLENCSKLAYTTSCHEGSPKKLLGFKTKNTKNPPKKSQPNPFPL